MNHSFSTLVELLDLSVQKFGENEFLGTKKGPGDWQWVTYREFHQLVATARGGLAAWGVGPGDRVGIVSDNRLEWAVLAFATFSLGAAYVPMYEAQQPEEWQFILNDCQAKVAVGSKVAIAERLQQLQPEIPSLQHVLGLDFPASHSQSYAALMERGRAHPTPAHPVTESDIAGYIYTSGTTGSPKGVKLSHGNFSSNVRASGSRFAFGPGDRSLAFLPWAHSFGQMAELYTLTFYGAAIAINDEVPQLLQNLPEVRPTILVAVPRIFNRIYDGVNKQIAGRPALIQSLFHKALRTSTKKRRGEKVSLGDNLALTVAQRLIFSKVREKFGGRLRFVISGSAALSTEVAEFIDALGLEVYEGYGLTETSPVISVNFPGSRKLGSVGPPIPGVQVRIDKEVTGDKLHGEIIVKGPNVMQGYHERPEENAAVFLPDGSLRTGDMGYLDEEGFLYITGRIKEQYKLENGKYVVPSPLEEELKLSPYILNVMLFGANRPHNVALVVLDVPALEGWAKGQGQPLGDVRQNPEVKKLIQTELARRSNSFKGYERPQDFLLITEDFTTENGQLTPSLKLKRRNVLARWQADLEALYSA